MSGIVALRGEIWEIDLNPRRGREHKGIRPCIIVSTDGLNRSRFGTVIACPITTTERPKFVWRPALRPADLRITDASWTPHPHWIETDQIVTVDVERRLIRHLAVVIAPDRMAEVDSWLRRLLIPE